MKTSNKMLNELEMTLPALGEHVGKVTAYSVVAEKGKQPYYALTISDGECELSTRLYAGRVAYFMGAIARQTGGAVAGMRTSQVLEYLTEHAFSVWVSYDETYGIQYNFSKPRD